MKTVSTSDIRLILIASLFFFLNGLKAQTCINNISNLRARSTSTVFLYKTWKLYLYQPTFYKVPSLYTLSGSDTLNISNTCASWSVQNSTIASVSNGVVTAKNGGSTSLIATLNGQSVSIPLVVNAEIRPVEYETNVDGFLTTPATNSIAQVPVVVICFIPTNDGININTTEADYSPIPTQTVDDLKKHITKISKHTKFSLEEGSKFRGYKDASAIPYVGYKIIDYIYVYEPIPRGFKDPGSAAFFGDFNVILDRFNGKKYVDSLGVKEFWIMAYHHGEIAPVESNMSSPFTENISNSYHFSGDLPIYSKTYIVYNYNYTREGNEATHNHGHQIESMVDYVATRQDGNTNLFTRNFRGYDGGTGPIGRVGDTHHPPNTRVDYDYYNTTLVASDILDWKPEGGTKTMVNSDTWGSLKYPWPLATTPDVQSNWYVLWLQSLPGYKNKIPYGTSNQMTNWWEFLSNWDNVTANIGLYKPFTPCTAPTFLNDITISLDASCANNDGNVSIIPTSGTAPFMYSKDGGVTYVPGADAGSGFMGLSAGIYKLRLKDANGCESAIVEREIKLNCATTCTPPTFLNNGMIVLNASCANNDGNITIEPTSGTGPFMYSIDGGKTYVSGADYGFTFGTLSAGSYQLRLKDSKGCESAIVDRSVLLNCATTTPTPTPGCTPPTFLNNGTIVLNASCANNDGNISIIPTSGTGPFLYSSNGGATYVLGADYGYTFGNLSSGTYQLRLKDSKGCESAIVERSVLLNCATTTTPTPTPGCTPPTFLNNGTIVLNASCANNDGNISIYPTSGTGPFLYSINGGTTYSAGPDYGYSFGNLSAGTYKLRLKDGGGCESAVVEKTVSIAYGTPCVQSTAAAVVTAMGMTLPSDAVSAYPNPTKGQFKLQLKGFISFKAEVSIFNGEGKLVQKRQLNLLGTNIVDFDLTGQANGMYYIKITNNNGTRTSKVLVQ